MALSQSGMNKNQAMNLIDKYKDMPIVQDQLNKYGVDINGVKNVIGGSKKIDMGKYDV